MKFFSVLISGTHKFAGSALMLHYVGTRTDGVQVHSEATLPGSSSIGSLCLWPAMVELPVVLPHVFSEHILVAK